MSSMNFLVVRDPGPYPLAKDAELCIREVVYCLKNRGFYPDTILFDQKENTTHTVRTRQDKLVLDPPSHRVDQHIMHLSRSSSRNRRAGQAGSSASASASM